VGAFIASHVRILLTSACGFALVVSFLPGCSSAAYVSALAGSYEAFLSAYESLRKRQLDVNLLMLVAAVGAIAVGQVRDAAGLLFLFSLSTTLESIAMSKTRSAIESLIRLRPSQAWKLEDDIATAVPVESLLVGDLIRIPAYESVPADAEIVEGTSRIDQSAMTGESAPVECKVGDRIVGGTQNLSGTLTAKVQAVVGDSALDRIVALVHDAQTNKASGERISEWFGQRYTLFVLGAFAASLAIRALIGQPGADGFYASLTLLVGMSPCALVISTPATTLSALAWCARNGILVRGGEFIERAGKIKVVATDKTGTLTWGRPVLQAMVFAPTNGTGLIEWRGDGAVPADLLEQVRLASAVELSSTHPIAFAILHAAKELSLVIPNVTEHRVVAGLGVTAECGRGKIVLGRENLLQQERFGLPDTLKAALSGLEAGGNTVSLLATPDGVSVLAFADGVRPGAKEFVRALRELGIRRIAIFTGDRRETAVAVARQVGIEDVEAGLLPGEKTARIKELGEVGPVLMVGDGVNDAPSLASASVGVAMGGLGSDIAMNAADVVLMHDHIERIPDFIRLGRRTTSVIRANLTFAGAMVLTLTIASLAVKLPLPIAVIGHEGSTVLVILNGLRMLRGPGSR